MTLRSICEWTQTRLASGGLYSKLRDCVATDASRCPWKKNGAPPLHRHGIRSSSDLASAENVAGRSDGVAAGTDWLAGAVSSRTASASASAVSSTVLAASWSAHAASSIASGCLLCLLLVMCTHPFAKKAFTLHLSRSEGHERYFGCNLMHRKALASSHQHLMAEAPAVCQSHESSSLWKGQPNTRGRHSRAAAVSLNDGGRRAAAEE